MLGAQGIIVDVGAKSAGADDGEHTRITPRDEAAECGDAAATFETDSGPRRAVRHSGPCRSWFWTIGEGASREPNYCTPLQLFLPFSSSFLIAYIYTGYLAPDPADSAAITTSLPKRKQKQVNSTSQ